MNPPLLTTHTFPPVELDYDIIRPRSGYARARGHSRTRGGGVAGRVAVPWAAKTVRVNVLDLFIVSLHRGVRAKSVTGAGGRVGTI